jgi:hypothetical protein
MAFPQAAGPIGYWKLDEAAGPSIDSIADADGTWNGPVQSSTDLPPLITFANCHSIRVRPVATAGAVNYVSLGRNAALDTSQNGSFTISAWFKPNSIPPAGPDGQYGIVLKTGLHEGLSLAGNGIVMGHWTGTDGDHYYAAGYGTTTVTAGQWHHVAGVVNLDPAVRKVFVYTNGQAPGFNAESLPIPADQTANAFYANQPWLLGINDPNGGDARYQADGWIDDVRIYNRALTLTEIQTLANGGTVGDPPIPAPTTPMNVQAVGSINQITVSWDPVPGATSYNIKRSTGSGFEAQYAIDDASPFIDTNVNPVDTFFYTVSAVVGCATSSDSAEVSAQSIAPEPRTHKLGKRHMCGWSTVDPGLGGLAVALLALVLVAVFARR